ncbi:MAG: hypothetical protein M1321_00090 [Candidatus Marsarchaeota archaeon]|nr:hypothetical protein [Candidatus Marsarchaeota archaeon]
MKLLISGKLKFKPGEISLLNDPMSILPMKMIKSMTDDMVREGMKGISELYYWGWVSGYELTYRLAVSMNLKKFEDRYKLVMDIAAMFGFGDYKTLSFEKAKYTKFNVIQNPFAKRYYPSKELVDHLLRGVNAGGGTVVHERIMNCIELECAAQNNTHCLFVNASDEVLSTLDQKVVGMQLDIKTLREKQIDFIRSMGHDSFIPLPRK